MIDKDLMKRYRFHREHGGGWVGHAAESALRAARVEQLLDEAIDLGVAEVEWVYDEEPYDPDDVCTEEEAAKLFESNAWTGPFGCVLKLDGDVVESLWGIVVGPRGTDDPYCRVVVADLALEIEDDLRQAIGDALDATCECGYDGTEGSGACTMRDNCVFAARCRAITAP